MRLSRERSMLRRGLIGASRWPRAGQASRARRLLIPVNGVHRKCRQADRNVFSALGAGRAVADPLAAMRNHGLFSVYVEGASAMLHAQHAAQYECKFFEFGGLSGLLPSAGAAHVRDAGLAGGGIHATDKLVNQLGFVAGGLDALGFGDECGHGFPPSMALF